jgi:UDP-glucose 4-epimerase
MPGILRRSYMKSLVTGGAGFIGSHLVRRLLELGHDVTVLDNFRSGNKLDKEVLQGIELVHGDVRDETTVFKASQGSDLIFHLAAVLGVDIVADNPVEAMETEVMGMKNVSQAALLCRADKVIYASTSGVYGKAAIERAVEEDFHASPNTSYAIAKRFNEIYLKGLYQEKNMESVSLRYFNVYGPKQDVRMVVPRFFRQALANSPITVYGTGMQTRDFTYIDDAVEATVLAAQRVGGCEIANVCNSEEHTVQDLAEVVVRITDSKSEIILLNPPEGRYDFEVERRLGSADKLKQLIGFIPQTPFEEGLKRTLEYILAH